MTIFANSNKYDILPVVPTPKPMDPNPPPNAGFCWLLNREVPAPSPVPTPVPNPVVVPPNVDVVVPKPPGLAPNGPACCAVPEKIHGIKIIYLQCKYHRN